MKRFIVSYLSPLSRQGVLSRRCNPNLQQGNRKWLSTASSSATDPSSESLQCPVLERALPELQSRFNKLAEKNGGTFPVLSPTITEMLHKRWTADDYDKSASVLIPLFSHNGIPSVLFTARSHHLPVNPSEISFPGGHSNEGESLEDTALREAQEELLGDYPWTDPQQLVILGRGTTIPAVTGTPVTPIIAVMMQEIRQSSLEDVFPGDSSEVEVVFGMPLQELLETEESHELPNHRLLGKERTGPRYPSPHGHIWGLTAFMLRPLLHKLYRPVFQLRK